VGKVYEATQKIKLDADAAVGYRIMCDFEKYPTWWKHVRTVNVLERDDRGVAVKVHYVFDIALKQGFKLTQHYTYDDENRVLHFNAVGGDFDKSGGFLRFTNTGAGVCEVEYYVKVELSMPLAATVLFFLTEKAMKDVLLMLKTEAEKQGTSG